MIYKDNGELWVFGYNREGQLGIGNNIDQYKPIILMKDKNIKQICCNISHHSMILKANGKLLIFGANYQGQLGFPFEEGPCRGNYMEHQYMPIILLKDDSIQMIACIGNSGELFVFGTGNESDKPNIDIPTLLIKNPTLKIIMNSQLNIIWSPNNHINYPKDFQDSVLCLLLYLKRNQIRTRLKIPRFVIYEIIKYAV